MGVTEPKTACVPNPGLDFVLPRWLSRRTEELMNDVLEHFIVEPSRRCAERVAELFGRKPLIYTYPYFCTEASGRRGWTASWGRGRRPRSLPSNDRTTSCLTALQGRRRAGRSSSRFGQRRSFVFVNAGVFTLAGHAHPKQSDRPPVSRAPPSLPPFLGPSSARTRSAATPASCASG